MQITALSNAISKQSIPWNEWVGNIERKISEGCPNLRNRIRLFEKYDQYASRSIGRAFYIDFNGYNEDPGQFSIIDDPEDPLVGDVSVNDSGLTFEAETIVEYNKNLFFDPIPFEMLKTYETKPQVIMSVGDLPAVCHNVTCGFDYVTPVGEITAFTQAGTKLTFTGTALPTDPEFYQRVMFAYSECTIDAATVTATGFECSLVRAETCGSW